MATRIVSNLLGDHMLQCIIFRELLQLYTNKVLHYIGNVNQKEWITFDKYASVCLINI